MGGCVNKMENIGVFRIIFRIALGIVILGGAFLLIRIFAFPLLGLFSSREARPEITHGEFPFRVEYELDGEIHIIEDILIVEFRGFVFSAGSMTRERSWKSHLASRENNNANTSILFEGTENLVFFPGSAGYYMEEFHGNTLTGRPHVSLDFTTRRYLLEDASELLAEYGITLVSWEISEPIVNNFGD